MSMHWYEDVVESSIRVLDEHDDGSDLHDLFAALGARFRPCAFSVEEIAALPEAVELRDISRRNKAMEIELHDNEPPPPDERTPVEAWWFAV